MQLSCFFRQIAKLLTLGCFMLSIMSFEKLFSQPAAEAPSPSPVSAPPQETTAPAPATLGAQTQQPSDEPESVVVSAPAVSEDYNPLFRAERDSFIQKLRTQIQPNLIKNDTDRLNKNVMRLGSYRADWVKQAMDFLLANSALAELFLYSYAQQRNPRLNKNALETLVQFSSYRDPRAALAFCDLFLGSDSQNDQVLELLSRVIDQDPTLANDAFRLLSGPIAKTFSLAARLRFSMKICPKVAEATGGPFKTLMAGWRAEASGFWESVLGEELDLCLKGGANLR